MSRRVSLQIPPTEGRLDLGVGHPGPDLLPLASVARSAAGAFAGDEPSLLQYGAEAGDEGFRAALAAFLNAQGGREHAARPAGLFVTSGASQALDLITTLVARPGDRVLVETPTYHLALATFADHGLEVVPVESDEDGIVPEALERSLEGHPAKLLYLVPAFANPSGRSLAPERHEAVRAITARHGVTLVADEVYRLLAFDGAPPPSLAADGAGHVVVLGSFSKILAPGLRLGWIEASPAWVERLERAGLLLSGGGLAPIASALVGPLLEDGTLERHLRALRATYAERAEALAASLARHLPQVECARARGGYYLWPRFPGADMAALLPVAHAHGVGYVPGTRFAGTGGASATTRAPSLADRARLCFAYLDATHLEEAAGRLGAALESASSSTPAGGGRRGPPGPGPTP